MLCLAVAGGMGHALWATEARPQGLAPNDMRSPHREFDADGPYPHLQTPGDNPGASDTGHVNIDISRDRDRTLQALTRRLAKVWPLRVVSWHLDAASAAGAVDIQPTPRRIWRHTFGAERRPASRANFDVSRLNANVVLLQGVRLLSHARLLFPARDWRVVVSRQIIRPVLARPDAGTGWGDQPRTATTAIAVRYQRGIRISGQEQITDVVAPLAGATGWQGAAETASALAVRLRVAGEVVWLVSADLAGACGSKGGARADPQSQGACEALWRWYRARRPGERVVIGGPNAATALLSGDGDRPKDCPNQMMGATVAGADAGVSDRPSRGALIFARNSPAAGCLAQLELAASSPAQ